ncbi:MAG: MogA/MoaB family molybdenum cofactor biosynthesis protein [Chloroflexi bacterium]|nr:MogA/MoaB family molybdenum cofactor biosynthesis protein [Chloroflexota bacterium]
MSHLEHKMQAPQSIGFAIVTISDSRTEETDESGRFLRQGLAENRHRVTAYALLKNDVFAIRQKLDDLTGNPDVQVILTAGGTGLSHRDLTIETVSPLLDKRLDGFGELFRSLSYQEIGTSAVLSRALAGIIRGKIIICLPGSLGAAKLALEKIILPEIGHMVREATR